MSWCRVVSGRSFLLRAGTVLLALCVGACTSAGIKTTNPDMPYNAYLDGHSSTVGVILCHGRGHHPTWDVVDPLRKGINQQLGYHTLSIQMPTGEVDWLGYRSYFPEAHKRIRTAIDVLRKEKGVKTIYLMGHSMGSRMATSFLAENPDAGVAGFIGVGIRNRGGVPLDSNANLHAVHIPVLDVYGDGGDRHDARNAAERADMVGERYTQVLIPGADHLFIGHEKEMVDVVVTWLKSQQR